MPSTGDGDRRYPKRREAPRAHAIVGGKDLGQPMRPSDIYIRLRRLLHLDDDELLAAFAAGVGCVERDLGPDPARPDAPALMELEPAERVAAAAEAREITRSRLDAWRKRHREMTWRELRVLFAGLLETV